MFNPVSLQSDNLTILTFLCFQGMMLLATYLQLLNFNPVLQGLALKSGMCPVLIRNGFQDTYCKRLLAGCRTRPLRFRVWWMRYWSLTSFFLFCVLLIKIQTAWNSCQNTGLSMLSLKEGVTNSWHHSFIYDSSIPIHAPNLWFFQLLIFFMCYISSWAL